MESTSEKQYTWNAADYGNNSSAQFEWAKELTAKLRLQGAETVLDVGCGDGNVTLTIARQVPHGRVVGIDNSESMIALANQRLTASSCGNAKFHLMDATAISFENQFDIIFSNAALHWVKDHVSMLEGIKRCLKKSGKILFQMGGKGNAQDIINIFDVMRQNGRWQPYFQNFEFPYSFYGPQEYTPLLTQKDFHRIRCDLIPKDMKHKGREGLAGWIRTTWMPYIDRIPQQQRETFIAELVDRYVDAFPMDHDGYIHVRMIRLEIEASIS